jgi:hypothetical protein
VVFGGCLVLRLGPRISPIARMVLTCLIRALSAISGCKSAWSPRQGHAASRHATQAGPCPLRRPSIILNTCTLIRFRGGWREFAEFIRASVSGWEAAISLANETPCGLVSPERLGGDDRKANS